jgi:hypothetical protein
VGFGGGVGEATRRELEEAKSGGIGRRIRWRDLVEENGGGIGGRVGHRRGETRQLNSRQRNILATYALL